ncbi:hypothetical protein NFI95_04920 [Acetobacteraceae bacterium KSS8]|uniref:Uncharacterized protein n=1 Tax=Endosaccharibacter trunci TaxID=2812733 RepID=A0ABT1W5U2_9PROT|nr:hypothetical protein [Acetobacteraceae bacterium KSS8]
MQQFSLNKYIASGLSKAAAIVGAEESLFRPSGPNDPVGGTPLMTLFCAWDVKSSFRMTETAQPNHAYATLMADQTLVQPGDYLVGQDTHFVVRVEPLRPALCVLCNETIDFLNTEVATTAGTNAYGGHVAANDTPIGTAWPVSMSARTRGGTDVTKLPSDTRGVYYDVLAPVMPGITLSFGMRVQDSALQDYEIISAELSDFGWKLVVGLATT